MSAIDLTVYRQDGEPLKKLQQAIDATGVLLHFKENTIPLNVVLIEKGTQSGAPSVMLWVPTEQGVVLVETTFAAWRTVTVAMGAAAEDQLGWREL